MQDKTIVIVSGLVDATIKEYQPDVDFKIFRTLEDLGNHLDITPIRAQSLFFTKDVLGGVNSSLSYLKELVTNNDYLSVDRVIYITEENSEELVSFNYLVDEFNLENWEFIEGSMSRAFVSEVINGTFRSDKMYTSRKAVYRKPRADYVKQQLHNKYSLQEEYIDDDNDLSDIPDVEIPEPELSVRAELLRKVYIAGTPGYERSVFALLAAQYLSKTDKVILIESDPEYHMITEFSTKSGVDAYHCSMTRLYEDTSQELENIRNTDKNLVIIECIDRIPFNYRFMSSLIYYNLLSDYTYLIQEIELNDIPHNTHVTVTVPSTVLGTLRTGEMIDKSLVPYCSFIGVNLEYLKQIHINSGIVMSTLLSDILSTKDIVCPVITVSSLLLNGSIYDLGGILDKEVLV